MIIDSCRNKNKNPAALSYLSELGVDVSTAVKLVVVTHWHDDHIRGISNVVRACTSADVAFSKAFSKREFLTILESLKKDPSLPANGIQELSNTISTLVSRSKRPKLATADYSLFENAQDGVHVSIHSLSPSAASILQAEAVWREYVADGINPSYRLKEPTPNESAVALWIKIGCDRILLGSDLECDNSPTGNWSVIANGSTVIDSKASVFKVAHHGSITGFNPQVHARVLLNQPTSILTPFRNGNRVLPKLDDINRIKDYSNRAFLTARVTEKKFKHANRTVQKLLEESTRKASIKEGFCGQIKLRKKISSESVFEVSLHEGAFQL